MTAVLVLGQLLISPSLLSAERVLNFPDSAPVGFVSCTPPPSYDGPFIDFGDTPLSVQRAQGNVVVPDECIAELELIGGAFKDLAFLSRLPSNSLQSLKIQDAKLDRDQMLSIVAVTSLQRLVFQNCEFTENAFLEIPLLRKLVELKCNDSRNFKTPRIELWIKDLPKLESIYVSPALESKALIRLNGHPSLTFINVTIENDFPQTLDALKKLPSLKGLQLGVSPRANNDLLEGIGQLSQLEWIRWFGGKVDTPTLAELSELPRLKRLDLLQFEADPGFCAGIALLKELERLEISTNSEFRKEGAQLSRSLFQLPKLKRWPKVEKVDFETLQAICNLDQIESLSFSHMSAVSSKQLKELGRLKNLVQLELEHVEVDDDWLSCLTEMNKLEYLSLFVTNVNGSGFQALSNLKALKRIRIFNELRELKLEPVAALPGLEVLQLGGHFQPHMLVPLQKSQSLKHLRLEDNGTVDDTTAAWIGECPGIVKLYLEGKFTDVAVDSIAKLPSIHNLGINGSSITKEGILKLASIPSMRVLAVGTTSEIDPSTNAKIRQQFPWLPFVSIRHEPPR